MSGLRLLNGEDHWQSQFARILWSFVTLNVFTSRLTDQENLLLTPFERNLAVWRQLWRTVERSQLVVQIVDARNPLGFRCEDLETYVREIDDAQLDEEETEDAEANEQKEEKPTGKRRNLLLVNKADLLTTRQR